MMPRAGQAGFTLVEIVVAIAISSVVVVFVGMFFTAPLGAYENQSRRNAMVGDVSAVWPRLQQDLRAALPDSVRVRVNGNYVALEVMPVVGVTRYTTGANINSTSIAIAGTQAGGAVKGSVTSGASKYLAVNPSGNVYALSGSITNSRRTVSWITGANGTATLTVAPSAPNFTAGDSPRRRLYFVDSPVTYLCDLRTGQGTLRRYAGYTVASSQTARDAPNEFGTAASNELVARGITSCVFQQSNTYADKPQTVAVRITVTRQNESVTLLHESRSEYLP